MNQSQIKTSHSPKLPNAPTQFPLQSWFETPSMRWQLIFGLPLLSWRLPSDRKSIYLSFDDGPVAGVTERILEILGDHQAKATFFCIGQNVACHPRIVQRTIELGHSVGNHSFSHLSGWKNSVRAYLADVERCDNYLPLTVNRGLRAFRPPFGQLGLVQGMRILAKRRIVMWDVNSMDYRDDQTPTMIENRVCENVRPGSIVLLHDSAEASPRTIIALPKILEKLSSQGYQFEAI